MHACMHAHTHTYARTCVRTHTHACTCARSLVCSRALSLSLARSLSHALSLSLALSLSRTLSLSHSLSLALSLTLSCSHSRTHTHTLALTLTLSHSLTLSLTHSLTHFLTLNGLLLDKVIQSNSYLRINASIAGHGGLLSVCIIICGSSKPVGETSDILRTCCFKLFSISYGSAAFHDSLHCHRFIILIHNEVLFLIPDIFLPFALNTRVSESLSRSCLVY